MTSPVQHLPSIAYFLVMLKASLVSSGGTGNLPSLHADFISRHWANDSDFGQALTIGQISPGPTGLWVVSFGYLTDGISGALLTTIAITIPPLLILVVKALHARVESHPGVQGFVRGVGLAAVGTFAYVLCQLMVHVGISIATIAIVIGAFGLASIKRIPNLFILCIAAITGLLIR